jgi:hypothetical protein
MLDPKDIPPIKITFTLDNAKEFEPLLNYPNEWTVKSGIAVFDNKKLKINVTRDGFMKIIFIINNFINYHSLLSDKLFAKKLFSNIKDDNTNRSIYLLEKIHNYVDRLVKNRDEQNQYDSIQREIEYFNKYL